MNESRASLNSFVQSSLSFKESDTKKNSVLELMIFNFFDKLHQIMIPNFIFTVFIVLLELQGISSAISGVRFQSGKRDSQILINIFLISPYSPETIDFIVFGAVFITITLLILLFVGGYCYYMFIKLVDMTKVIAAIFIVLIDLIAPLLICPTAFLIQKLTLYLLSSATIRIGFVVLVIFLCLSFFIQIGITWMALSFFSINVNAPFNELTSVTLFQFFLSIFVPPITNILYSIFYYYPKWAQVFLFSIEAVIFLVIFIICLLKPILNPRSFSTNTSYSITCFISVLFILFRSITKSKDITFYETLIIYLFFIVLSIIIYGILRFRIAKFKKNLAYDGVRNIVQFPFAERAEIPYYPTDECYNMCRNRFNNLSVNQSLYYLSVGLQYGCDLFVDSTLIKFLFETKNDSGDVLKFALRTMNGFPAVRKYVRVILKFYIRTFEMSFTDRFFFYQVRKIQMLWQTSISSFHSAELQMAIVMNKEFLKNVAQSWLQPNITLTTLKNVHDISRQGSSIWKNLIYKCPNLIIAYTEYMKFSFECKTNFVKGVKLRKIIDYLEDGHTSIKSDLAFISLVKTFPFYLKKRILSPSGNILINSAKTKLAAMKNNNIKTNIFKSNINSNNNNNNNNNKVNNSSGSENSGNNSNYSTNNSSGSSSSSNSSIDFDFVTLDASEIEQTSRNILSHSRLRMAFYRTTKDMASYYTKNLFIFNLMIFAIMLTVAIAEVSVFYNSYATSIFFLPIYDQIMYFRTNYTSIGILLLLKYVKNYNRLDFWTPYESLINQDHIVKASSTSFIYTNKSTIDHDIFMSTKNVLDLLQTLIYDYIELATNSEFTNIYLPMFSEMPAQTCAPNGSILHFTYSNVLKAVAMNMIFVIERLKLNTDDWFLVKKLECSFLYHYFDVPSMFYDLRFDFYYSNQERSNQLQKRAQYFSIYFPICLFLLMFLFYIFITSQYIKELTKVTTILSNVDEKVKAEGAKSLTKINLQPYENSNGVISEAHENSIKYFFYIFFNICLFAVFCMLVFSIGNSAKDKAINDKTVSYWSMHNAVQFSQIIETYEKILHVSILNQFEAKHETVNELTKKLQELIDGVFDFSLKLVANNEDGRGILGFSDKLSQFYLDKTCDTKSNFSDLNKNYVCKSLQHQINILISSIRNIQVKCTSSYHIKLTSDDIEHLIEDYILINNFILPNLVQLHQYVNEISDDFNYQFELSLFIQFAAAVLVSILTFFACLYFNKILDSIFVGGIILLRRLPPLGIASNQSIMNFLLRKDFASSSLFSFFFKNKNQREMTVTQSIMFHSQDMIFYVSNEGTIEGVNQATLQHLSLTYDQLIGQSVESLFDEQSKAEVKRVLSLIQKKEAQGFIELNVTCLTANIQSIYCGLRIFQKTSSHIVFILTDLTSVYEKQQIAEKEKEKSEELLFHILPPFIVRLINSAEKNISLSVACSSIMFIDIVKFSEFSRFLSPEQILGALSIICEHYDRQITKYKSITKIKMIGDIYMAAAGLFDPNMPPVEHANEIIKFGFDCLGIIEDLDMKMNFSLSVRIGVNTGGPIIAGVLGTDKLAFDIIGDPINIASRLQTTGQPGTIHVSEDTYKLISNLKYNIECRGSTFLKGKGNVLTYQINQEETTAIFS